MMTDIKKTRKRSASESEATLGSQDSVLQEFDTLEVNSQQDDSASESVFKKPRLSRRKKLPTETPASKKLDYNGKSYLPDPINMELLIPEYKGKLLIAEHKIMQKVSPLCGNYIMDLAAMVLTLSEVATCKRCKWGNAISTTIQ